MVGGATCGSQNPTADPERDLILARLPFLVYVINVGASQLEFVNDQSLTLLGYDARLMMERGLSFFRELTHPEDLPRVTLYEERWATANDGETLESEYRLKHADQRWRWIRRREVVLARDADKSVTKILGTADDVTDRKVSHRHLVRHHERLLQLLAYDIHDGFVQDVVGAQLALESVLETLTASNPECMQELVVIRGLLCKAINEGRRMISELRPIIIDEMGVIEAIHYLVNEEQAAERMNIRFTHDVQFQRLGPMLEGTIFRIVQESLNNVRRHAGVTEAEVRLLQRGGTIQVEVEDQGVGFDPNSVQDHHFGLEGIRERARLFGGRAIIRSQPGSGTLISVELPTELSSEWRDPRSP